MKIKAITIENFKSISEPVRIEFKPLTLLFGPNSAGKSTIIQALHYIREVLEFRRLDVDKTISGGDFIDLGGFDNFVHGHDTSKKVSFKIELQQVNFSHDVTGDPTFYGEAEDKFKYFYRELYKKNGDFDLSFSVAKDNNEIFINSYEINFKNLVTVEGFGKQNESVIAYKLSIDDEDDKNNLDRIKSGLFINDEFLQCHTLAIEMNSSFDQAKSLIQSATQVINILGDSIVSDELYNINSIGKDVYTKLHSYDKHNNFDALLEIAIDTCPERILFQNKKLSLSCETRALNTDWNSDFSLCAKELAERCVVGTIVDELKQMLYVGPLRTIPPRNYSPQKTFAPSRWSDGLAAWDKASYSNQETIDEINKWLGKKCLETGYELKTKGVITLDNEEIKLLEDYASLSEKDLVSLAARLNSKKLPKVILAQSKAGLEDGLEVSLCDVGVGISQTFPVVMAALDKDFNIVIIEQPELHIHPRLQVELGDLFISAAKQGKGKCIIIETHSEHLILRLMRRMRETADDELPEGMVKVTPDDVSILYVQPTATGSVVRTLELDVEGQLLDPWPGGFFEEGFNERFA